MSAESIRHEGKREGGGTKNRRDTQRYIPLVSSYHFIVWKIEKVAKIICELGGISRNSEAGKLAGK
jgi:hypothetical protein